jgi:membrane protease YdiL (CAAX protease family)
MTPSPPKNALFILLGYIVAVLLLGALLAPPLFWAGKALAQAVNNEFLKQTAFVSYYDRAALLVALLGLPYLFKAMQLQRQEVIGNVSLSLGWKQLLIGFVLALALIILMGVVAFDYGVFKMAKRPPWGAVFMPLLSGFSVAFIEEFLFRGAVFSVLNRSLGARGAILWTTLIFAIVHFLKPPAHESLADAEVTWTSGFWVVTQLFRGFASLDSVVPEFLLLAGVGAVLALARQATTGLWASIGLHAGWVAGMKYFSSLTSTTKALRAGEFAPWMVENHCKAIVSSTVGLVPLIAVLVTGALMLGVAQTWRKREI